MRKREIAKDFWSDPVIASYPPVNRLFMIAIWAVSDVDGIFEYDPGKLRFQVLPGDAFDPAEALAAFQRDKFIGSYTVRNKKYGYWRSWHKHQDPHGGELPQYPKPMRKNRMVVRVAPDGFRCAQKKKGDPNYEKATAYERWDIKPGDYEWGKLLDLLNGSKNSDLGDKKAPVPAPMPPPSFPSFPSNTSGPSGPSYTYDHPACPPESSDHQGSPEGSKTKDQAPPDGGLFPNADGVLPDTEKADGPDDKNKEGTPNAKGEGSPGSEGKSAPGAKEGKKGMFWNYPRVASENAYQDPWATTLSTWGDFISQYPDRLPPGKDYLVELEGLVRESCHDDHMWFVKHAASLEWASTHPDIRKFASLRSLYREGAALRDEWAARQLHNHPMDMPIVQDDRHYWARFSYDTQIPPPGKRRPKIEPRGPAWFVSAYFDTVEELRTLPEDYERFYCYEQEEGGEQEETEDCTSAEQQRMEAAQDQENAQVERDAETSRIKKAAENAWQAKQDAEAARLDQFQKFCGLQENLAWLNTVGNLITLTSEIEQDLLNNLFNYSSYRTEILDAIAHYPHSKLNKRPLITLLVNPTAVAVMSSAYRSKKPNIL